MVRGTGKFEQKRGGGRSFNEDLGTDGVERSKTDRKGEDGIEKEHSDKGFEGEESSEEEAGPATPATPELARQQRREMKKQAKAGENDKKNISILGEPRVLTRREQEKKDAKDRYLKLRLQGKTHDAKRLKLIREEREAAQAKREAEAEAKTQEAEAKYQAQLAKRGSNRTAPTPRSRV